MGFELDGGFLTVDNQTFLKPRIGRVTNEEEDVDKADEAHLAWPPLSVYQDFPRMDITANKLPTSLVHDI